MRIFIKYYMINTSIAAVFFMALVLFGPEPKHQDWAADVFAFVTLGWCLGWFVRRCFEGIIASSTEARDAMSELTGGELLRPRQAYTSRRDIDVKCEEASKPKSKRLP